MSIFDSIGHFLGHPFGGDDGEKAAKAAAQQMEEYRKQREVVQGQLQMERQKSLNEKNRLDEKQVRSLRHSYSSDGLLSNMQDVNQGSSQTSNVTGG